MNRLKKLWNSFTKYERSWIAYDWANSVYATNIMAAIFPIYYATVAGDLGSKWFGIGVSIASLIVAVLAPVLGSVGDIRGYKKKLLTFFLILGVVFTATMAIFDNWQLMLVGYIISRIGFSGANVFYDSFLTDVTTDDRMDRISSWGYAMGYIGGSTIPFIISIVVMILGNYSAWSMKFSILIVSVWWAVFSIPILRNVKQVHYIEAKANSIVKTAWRNFVETVKGLGTNRGLLIFIIAYFFYIDGVDTIISMATSYGTTLGLGTIGMILALLVTQLVAVPCSILFSRLAGKFHSIRMIFTAVCIYFVICIVGFSMGLIAEPAQLAYAKQAEATIAVYAPEGLIGKDAAAWDAISEDIVEEGKNNLASDDREADFFGSEGFLNEDIVARLSDPESNIVYEFETVEGRNLALAAVESIRDDARYRSFVLDEQNIASCKDSLKTASVLFWVLAALVGTVQGGIQALSRSYFGKLIPPERSNEYFGFYDIFGKFAAVIGPALYSLCYILTGRASIGILSLILLFGAGGVLLLLGKKELAATETAVRLAKQANQED